MSEPQSRRAGVRERVVRVLGVRSPAHDERQALQQLQERIEHLETLVEGLQDSVHRDSQRHDQRMTELERKTQPDLLAKALSEYARRRGI
jgi:predicted component of type VI protein secretion system